jgi:hypothetical protein
MTEQTPQRIAGTQAEFAAYMRVTKPRVTVWLKAGRLAFTKEGQVHFANSKIVIEATSGNPGSLGAFSVERMKARERKDHYDAENARLNYEERCGNLIETATLAAAAANAGATIRSHAENMPDILSPRLAVVSGGDEDRCRAILTEWVEAYLGECSAAFVKMARIRNEAPKTGKHS